MKKLMIAVAIVCAAAFANAASYTWGVISDANMGPAGSEFTDGSGYLIDAVATLYVGGTEVISGTIDENYQFGHFDTTNPLSSDLITSTTAGQAFSIVFVTEDGWTQTLNGVSVEDEVMVMGGDNLKLANFQLAEGTTTDGWVKAVPEPTSGLLLLLGVAGLALRRRRA